MQWQVLMERRVALLPTQKFVPCGKKDFWKWEHFSICKSARKVCYNIYIFKLKPGELHSLSNCKYLIKAAASAPTRSRFLIQSLRRCTSEWILISHFLYSNRSRTPPTSTSPTCPCLWMSKSWRACSSLLARSFPPASSEMLMGPAAASDLPGQTVASHGGPSCLAHIFCYQSHVICAALARTNRMQTALLERD